MRSGILVLFLFSALSSELSALENFRVSGNFKELYTRSRSILDDQPYWQNLARLSLIADARQAYFVAHVDYRTEMRNGSYFDTRDYRLFGLGHPPFYFRWEDRIRSGDGWQWNQGIYRGWAGFEADRAALRFGRQRIAWGTGKLWNPTDVLNPYNPLSVEREDRRGVDVAYFRILVAQLSQFEVAYAPQDTERDTQFLEKLRTHWGRADLSILGGKVAGDKGAYMVGGDLAMDVADGQFHAEATQTDPIARNPYARWLVGYEYRFTEGGKWGFLDGVWALAEYYHNGAGETNPRFYDFSRVLSGREVALARDYAGAGLTYEITPLWTAEVYGIRNLNDRSVFVGPTLKWNAMTELDLLLGAQIFSGKPPAEFGRAHTIFYFHAQYFFGI